MRLARFSLNGSVGVGVVEDTVLHEIKGADVFSAAKNGFARTGRSLAFSSVRLLPPCCPSKIVAIGLNYKAHAAEFNKPLPEEPLLFLKPSTSVIGHGGEIVYPSHMSRRVDFEAELALVIACTAKDISRDEAQGHIFGYTCFNDVTARDLQGKDIQYTRAKGFDTFSPIGPWIETSLNPLDIRIESYLNGEKKQDSCTRDMIFDVFFLVSFVSRVMTLLPGDVIATGTPSGVGRMKPGDTIEIRVHGIGSLVNTVVAGP
ncbi:MAG: fumarylacetoacetate hydrolase family protein [Deltaproteobacteria bacterium]|nr:fumarylacetoacetate hydrolase family protein [Deltaproteobacteria bacterium]